MAFISVAHCFFVKQYEVTMTAFDLDHAKGSVKFSSTHTEVVELVYASGLILHSCRKELAKGRACTSALAIMGHITE